MPSRLDAFHVAAKVGISAGVVSVLVLISSTRSPDAGPPATVVSPAAEPPASDDLATELDRRFTQDVVPLLSEYCLHCHSGDEPSGDVRLDLITHANDTLTGDFDLRLFREMVGSGEMPPKKEDCRPSDHERLVISQWADAMLDYVPADAPIDPGWFTIHRLNRTEYLNTLRDLLGIDPASTDLAAKLPSDDTGYGFDNIADVLSTSPIAVEQYLDAAEIAVDAALGPIVECGDQPRSLGPLKGENGQPLARGGFFLYSNGPASGRCEVPLAGEYVVRVRAWETQAGDGHAHLSLRLDQRSIGEFDVTGTRESPQEFRVPVRCGRGEHTIAARFTNDYYVQDVGDRNLGVESISIAGPIDEATTDRPKVWRQVFGAGGAVDTGKDSEVVRASEILRAFAERAYRRPVDDRDVRLLMGVYGAERDGGATFERSIRTALTAALVSPNFLFRAIANPNAADPDARYTLDAYELASRLSYFIWSSMPDRPLLDSAGDGTLVTDDGLARQVRRMIADPRSMAFVENFSGQWLQLRGLERVAIDLSRFPEYTPALRADMLREATMFFADVLASDRSVMDLVSSKDTFLNDRLARHYGVPGVTGGAFRRVTLPDDSPRGGVLTMGAILTLTSNTTRTSPVKRGLFVLDQMLGTPPPPPPADVPPLEQSKHAGINATVREQLAAHVAAQGCAVCHDRLDPLGLSFEHFDAIGRWRDSEKGASIDASGTLPSGDTLNGTGDLKRTILRRSDQFVEALSAKVLTYALGRGVEPFDRPAVRMIAARTRAHGDRLSAMIESVALSETFRTCRGRKPSHD